MFFSLIKRSIAVAKFVESGRLVGDAEYKENVIQYLAEGRAFNSDGSVGSRISLVTPVDRAAGDTVQAASAVQNKAA